jgi:hypothetical protein
VWEKNNFEVFTTFSGGSVLKWRHSIQRPQVVLPRLGFIECWRGNYTGQPSKTDSKTLPKNSVQKSEQRERRLKNLKSIELAKTEAFLEE